MHYYFFFFLMSEEVTRNFRGKKNEIQKVVFCVIYLGVCIGRVEGIF